MLNTYIQVEGSELCVIKLGWVMWVNRDEFVLVMEVCTLLSLDHLKIQNLHCYGSKWGEIYIGSETYQQPDSASTNTSPGNNLNLCVMVTFILTAALFLLLSMSTLEQWILCLMNAPLSIPACKMVVKSSMAMQPIQVM